uniref:Uncharacterized protein n=1 Tax=viral metagenome TaxID=1070528 RepID=A0A6C0DR74_9ZZZZ
MSQLISWVGNLIRSQPSIHIPETVILVITTHGIIKLQHKYDYNYTLDDIPKYTIPSNMTVYKATSVPPGTCNFVNTDTTKDFLQKIAGHNPKLDTITNDNELLSEMRTIIRTYQGSQEEFTINIRKDISIQKKIGADYDNESEDFLNAYEQGGVVSKYESGSKMLNKTYLRDNVESHQYYDWQIIGANIRGQPDLVPIIQGKKSHYGKSDLIDMEQIIDFLKTRGAKRIIIFDLACSNYRSVQINEDTGEYIMDSDSNYEIPQLVDSGISDRTLRLLRTSLLKEGLHGGRKRKSKKAKGKKMTKRKKTIRTPANI